MIRGHIAFFTNRMGKSYSIERIPADRGAAEIL